MTSRSRRVPLRLAAVSALGIVLSACGEVVVDVGIDAQMALRNSAGKVQQAGEVVRVPRPGTFDLMQYRGPDFDFGFSAGAYGVGGPITNRTPTRLCVRFDEATLASNFHPEPVALQIYHWTAFVDKWERKGTTDTHKQIAFTPSSYCIEPSKEARFSFWPDVGALFPSGKNFNLNWPDKEPNLSDKGIGNWIALTLPIEIDGKRQILDVKLTATDSKARVAEW